MLGDPLTYTVIGICALVSAGQLAYAGILRNLQRHPVLLSKLLQLCHNTLRDTRFTFSIQAVRHAFHQVYLHAHMRAENWGALIAHV